MGLLSYLLVLGCVSVINAQEHLPARCAAVSCLLPDCLNRVTPPGECCPVCEDSRPDCRLVRCGRPLGCAVEDLFTPPGQCCPICRPRGEKPGRCPGRSARQRLSGVSTCVHQCTSDYDCQGRQKCCESGCSHFCMRPMRGGRPNCNRRSCPQLRCASQYTPQGQCCPICRPPGPVDCTLVDCADPICPGGSYTPPSQCCPVCLPTGY